MGIFFIGLNNYKIKYFKIFLPDVPLMLYPLMIIIELASYVIRSFSLAIRLSANIMAGHILVHILADAIKTMSLLQLDLIFLAICLLVSLFVLEFGVACLQAYVFTLLICIYLNDAVNLPVH
jgi:F-type H+-transporting ATPase subunit a